MVQDMGTFEFEIEAVFNMTSSAGVSRAFSGKMLHGSLSQGDKARLNVDGFNFILDIKACEISRKKAFSLSQENGPCAVLASINPPREFQNLQRERGLSFLVGLKIENLYRIKAITQQSTRTLRASHSCVTTALKQSGSLLCVWNRQPGPGHLR